MSIVLSSNKLFLQIFLCHLNLNDCLTYLYMLRYRYYCLLKANVCDRMRQEKNPEWMKTDEMKLKYHRDIFCCCFRMNWWTKKKIFRAVFPHHHHPNNRMRLFQIERDKLNSEKKKFITFIWNTIETPTLFLSFYGSTSFLSSFFFLLYFIFPSFSISVYFLIDWQK